jgi:TonB family protein
MNGFVNYLFESGISLCLFTLLFLLLLQQETFFRLNRYFLLFGLFFSLSLPLMHLRVYEPQPVMLSEITVLPYRNLIETVSVYGNSVSERVAYSVSTRTWLIGIYLTGFLFFTVRLLIRLLQIVLLIQRGKIIKEQGMNLVVLDKDVGPFSFLSFVFVGHQLKQQVGWEKMLIHEFEHVRQRHSFDILFLEIITAFQWCNPFLWLLKRVLRENHEYLADQAVLRNESNPSFYKQVLLTRFIGIQMRMTNNFNYSLIKKRIKMMSKIKSSRLANIKLLTGILVAIALIIAFACEQKEMQLAEKEQNGKVVSVSLTNGGVLQLSGDSNAIQSLKTLLAKNPDIELTAMSGNDLKITPKSKDVDEVVVVAYEKENTIKEEQVFVIVEDMPEFPGGEMALRKFIAAEVKYPAVAQEKGIQGKVYVSFVVEADGSVGRLKIARGVDPSLDQEALRIVSALPRWIPGKQGGKSVAVSYTVPISFVLQ